MTVVGGCCCLGRRVGLDYPGISGGIGLEERRRGGGGGGPRDVGCGSY